MNLLMGLIVGILFGFVSSLLPGLSSSITFLLIAIPGIDPIAAIGFLIGSECVSGILKQINVLNPSARADEVYTNEAILSFNKEEGKKMAALSVTIYSLIKVIGLAFGAVLFISGIAKNLNFGLYFQPLAIGIVLLMWGKLIFNSPHKLQTLVIVVASAFLGWMVTKSTPNAMLITSSCLIGIPQCISMISQKRDDKKHQSYEFYQKEYDVEKSVNLSAAFAGVISTLFYGCPQSALIQAFDDQQDPEQKVIQSAAADGAASSLGLIMVMSSGSARSAIASNISMIMPAFNIVSAVGILFLVLVLTFTMYWISPSIIEMMGSKSFNPKFVGIISLGLTSGLVLMMGGISAVLLIGAGIVLNQTIKTTKSPSSVTLVPISAIPILALIGI